MNKSLLIEIRDLLEFETRQAKRHNLDEIRITVPRAVALSHAISEALKQYKICSPKDINQ